MCANSAHPRPEIETHVRPLVGLPMEQAKATWADRNQQVSESALRKSREIMHSRYEALDILSIIGFAFSEDVQQRLLEMCLTTGSER